MNVEQNMLMNIYSTFDFILSFDVARECFLKKFFNEIMREKRFKR